MNSLTAAVIGALLAVSYSYGKYYYYYILCTYHTNYEKQLFYIHATKGLTKTNTILVSYIDNFIYVKRKSN